MRSASLGLFALSLLVASALAAPARADTLRAGVPVDAVTPSGMSLVDVRVPSEAGHPVRLSFASSPNGETELLVDVRIAPDIERARRALAWRKRTVAGATSAVANLGDEAFGSRGLVALRRANVVFSLLRVRGSRPITPLARHVDRAVLQAPAGAPRAAEADVTVPRGLQRDVSEPVRIEGDVLAASVQASGAVYARRTRDGWVLTRTRPGDFDVHVVWVDRLLRTGAP